MVVLSPGWGIACSQPSQERSESSSEVEYQVSWPGISSEATFSSSISRSDFDPHRPDSYIQPSAPYLDSEGVIYGPLHGTCTTRF